MRALVVVAVVPLLAGCAGGGASAGPPPSCATTVSNTLDAVAERVYAQAAGGRAVAASQARLARSPALARAVARNDRAATLRALHPLLRAQIKRISITGTRGQLVTVGRRAAVAPVRGTITLDGQTVGHYVLSVERRITLTRLLHELTGAGVTVGGRRGFVVTRYPSGTERLAVHTSSAPVKRCGASTSATVARTLASIGKRLFRAETDSGHTRDVLRLVARDPRFVHAVAARDPGALRAQIVRFFQDPQLHVVRIRATDPHGRVINDVGGPYVLAPASAPVHEHRRRIGTVTLSVQDDAGYIKLLHRFTGAGVVLRSATGVVPGSAANSGEPAVAYTVRSFPSGPLNVTLTPRT